MTRHANPLTISLVFLAAALAVHAYSSGEWATAWLMLLAYAGGVVSGVLLTLLVLNDD